MGRIALGPNHPDFGKDLPLGSPRKPRFRTAVEPRERPYETVVACGSCGTPKPLYARCYACKPRRWARNFDRCTNCGTTERPHNSGGLCSRCASARRYREYPPSGPRVADQRPVVDGQPRCRRCNEPVEPGKHCAPCRERTRARSHHAARTTEELTGIPVREIPRRLAI